jgi:hypothetical protein
MLLKKIASVLLLLTAAHVAGAPTVGTPIPKYATQLEKFSSYENIAQGTMRVRVSVATDALSSERNVRIGDVLLCSSSGCYRAHTSGFVDIINTAGGAATAIADVAMPVGVKITDVFFTETNKGASALTGHLALKTPMFIDPEYPSAELLIGVRKQALKGQTSYTPTQAATSFFNPESVLVHYLPSLQTTAKLALDVVLTIPAGALDEPQVFHIGVNDAGNLFPSIDIYPYLKLSRPAIVEAPPIPHGISAHEMIVAAGSTMEETESFAAPNSRPRRNARVQISQTGVIKAVALEDAAYGEPQAPANGTQPDASATCAQTLANPFFLGFLNLEMLKTGAVNIHTCETIKPYIHMLYINTADARIKFSIPYSTSSIGLGNAPHLQLKRIDEFPGGSIATINGFTWEGGLGLFPWDQGAALGIVRANGTPLGDNILLGGTKCPSCKTAGNEFVMAYGSDKKMPAFGTITSPSSLGIYTTNVVSSSTSVVNNGTCQTPGGENRWSAVGAHNGRMLLVSSSEGGTTSAAELCPVFKALKFQNALRWFASTILAGRRQLSWPVKQVVVNPSLLAIFH